MFTVIFAADTFTIRALYEIVGKSAERTLSSLLTIFMFI